MRASNSRRRHLSLVLSLFFLFIFTFCLVPRRTIQAATLRQDGDQLSWTFIADDLTVDQNELQVKRNGEAYQTLAEWSEGTLPTVFIVDKYFLQSDADRELVMDLATREDATIYAYEGYQLEPVTEQNELLPQASNYPMDGMSALRVYGESQIGEFTPQRVVILASNYSGPLELQAMLQALPYELILVGQNNEIQSIQDVISLEALEEALDLPVYNVQFSSTEPENFERLSLYFNGEFGAFVAMHPAPGSEAVEWFSRPFVKTDEIGTAGSSGMGYDPEVLEAMDTLENYFKVYPEAIAAQDPTVLKPYVLPGSAFDQEISNYVTFAPEASLLSYELSPVVTETGFIIQTRELYAMERGAHRLLVQSGRYQFQDGKLQALSLESW